MKVIVEKTELLDALGAVGHAVSARPQKPALSGVLISADVAYAELATTDGEMSMRVPIGASVEVPGEVLVPAKLLLDVVRTLPDETVALEVDEETQNLLISSGTSVFDLRILRADEFPTPPASPNEDACLVPGEEFAQAIEQVQHSVARDDDRPVLTSVLVAGLGKTLRLVATDAYRLSIRELDLAKALPQDFEINVPVRTLREVARVIGQKGAEEVEVHILEQRVAFRIDRVVIASRLLAGHFPNYRQLLPETSEHDLQLASAEFADAIRRVSVVAQKNTPIRLSLKPGELTVSAKTPDVGGARETMPVNFRGEPFEIGFNPDYLRDGLDGVSAPELTFKLINPLRPGVIEAGGLIYLLMPIRLNRPPEVEAPEEVPADAESAPDEDDPGF